MFDPIPELPDDTPTESVRFPTRIRNALNLQGLNTVGEIRDASDYMLMSFPDIGRESVSYLRKTLGLPSSDGIRPGKEEHTLRLPIA
jgi:DNA-directed RNA polymerase alpha subunit